MDNKLKKLDIFIAGVGGQGTLLASRILGNYAVKAGMDCKLSEVHGMAQRGGSVVTHVRMGEKVWSPIIPEGTADALLGFEQLEILRSAFMVKENGFIITDTQRWTPAPVAAGAAVYPDDIPARLKSITKNFIAVNALKLAAEAGEVRAGNTVMIGVLSKALGLDIEVMKEALEEAVPPAARQANVRALEAGHNAY